MADARRGNVYTGIYRFSYDDGIGKLENITEVSLIQAERLIDIVNEMREPVIFSGDANLLYKDLIKAKACVPYILAPAHMAQPRAASVAALGRILYDKGMASDARDHVPFYLRATQAERERAGLS